MSPVFVALVVAAVAHPGCAKTFTYHMDTRAAWAVYAGTREVPQLDVRMLRRIARCQRRPSNMERSRRFNAARRGEWLGRRADLSMQPALASWYNLEGSGACGTGAQVGYHFASLILPCGAQIKICHYSACVVGTMADHGPYVGGRTFDLNVNMRNALSCAGVCSVRWRRL